MQEVERGVDSENGISPKNFMGLERLMQHGGKSERVRIDGDAVGGERVRNYWRLTLRKWRGGLEMPPADCASSNRGI